MEKWIWAVEHEKARKGKEKGRIGSGTAGDAKALCGSFHWILSFGDGIGNAREGKARKGKGRGPKAPKGPPAPTTPPPPPPHHPPV